MYCAPPKYPKKILVISFLVQGDIPQRGHQPAVSATTSTESADINKKIFSLFSFSSSWLWVSIYIPTDALF